MEHYWGTEWGVRDIKDGDNGILRNTKIKLLIFYKDIFVVIS